MSRLANLFGLGAMNVFERGPILEPQISNLSGAFGSTVLKKLILGGAAGGAALGMGASIYSGASVGETVRNTMIGAGVGAMATPASVRAIRSGISAYRLGRDSGLGRIESLRAMPRRAGRMFVGGALMDQFGLAGNLSLSMARVGKNIGVPAMKWSGLTVASSFFASQGRAIASLGTVGAQPLSNAALFRGHEQAAFDWAKSRVQASGLL